MIEHSVPEVVETEAVARAQEMLQRPEATPSALPSPSESSTSCDFEVSLSAAFQSIPVAPPSLVWETGVWKTIFGEETANTVDSFLGATLVRPAPRTWDVLESEVSATQRSAKRLKEGAASFHDIIKFKLPVSWKEQRDADMQQSLKLWLMVANRWSDTCSFRRQIDDMLDDDEVADMFGHIFAGRSPITIRKRGRAIERLCNFLGKSHADPFPPDEKTMYKFLCWEKRGGAPPSRLKGYMQAINFTACVMSVDELKPIASSRRCMGICMEDVLKERSQASPLTVLELNKLHEVLWSSEADAWNRLFAGAALFCVYARARWGDLMRSETVVLDKDEGGNLCFLEARTGRHKTMRAQMHRHQFLPMVAPTLGIDGRQWGTPWLAVRSSLGLQLPPDGLVMPAPDAHGVATERPVESSECSAWLRKLLKFDKDKSFDRRLSSHSMKATFLSFAAKRGISVQDRLQLGYHSSKLQMGLVYSRDGAAASLLILEKLIQEICEGKFKPDSTRSGRILGDPEMSENLPEIPAATPKEENAAGSELVEDLVSDEDLQNADCSSSSSTSSSQDESNEESASERRMPEAVVQIEGFEMWQHTKSMMLHSASIGQTRVFVCGRRIGALHTKVRVASRHDSPTCLRCFKEAS